MFAIAEFGSISRSTSDQFSDRDLLIICSNNSRSKLYASYSEKGYSVTLLYPSQLLHMQKQGSLFIQHLKKEANILIDSDCKLSRFLCSCELTPPSPREIERCTESVRFISGWNSSLELSAWKADFLFCISRDLLIKSLATKNIIAFGLESLEVAVARYFGITESDFHYLHILREAKAAYRSNRTIPANTIQAINIWLGVLGEAFSIELDSVNDSPELGEDFSALKSRKYNSPYERLRSLEGVYLIARANGLTHTDHDLIIKHITSPNLYGSSQVRKSHIIQNYLHDVVALLANNHIQPTHFPLRSASLQMRG